MARPKGSKNKTTQELKIEADLIKKKAEIKELEIKKKQLADERRQG